MSGTCIPPSSRTGRRSTPPPSASACSSAAERVFAEHGLDAPMPAVARAAGAGVGSLYRQFASKDELVAALAERRLTRIGVRLEDALAQPAGLAGAARGHRGDRGRRRRLRPRDRLRGGRVAGRPGPPQRPLAARRAGRARAARGRPARRRHTARRDARDRLRPRDAPPRRSRRGAASSSSRSTASSADARVAGHH